MKANLLIAILCFTGLQAFAQKVYIKLGAGQAIPAAGTTNILGWPLNGSIIYNNTDNLSGYEIKMTSLGAGIYGNVGISIDLGKNLGLEVNSMMGVNMKKNIGTRSYPDNGYYISERNKIYAKHPVFIAPSLVMRTGRDFNLYMRAGLLFPLGIKFLDEFDGTIAGGTGYGRYEGTQEFKTNFSLGFSGATGFSFSIIRRVDVYGEVALNAISLTVKERIYTRYTENGNDALNDIPANQRDIKYYKKGNGSNDYPIFSMPFSNIGFNAGIMYKF